MVPGKNSEHAISKAKGYESFMDTESGLVAVIYPTPNGKKAVFSTTANVKYFSEVSNIEGMTLTELLVKHVGVPSLVFKKESRSPSKGAKSKKG